MSLILPYDLIMYIINIQCFGFKSNVFGNHVLCEISMLVDYSSVLDFVRRQSLICVHQDHVIHEALQNHGKSHNEVDESKTRGPAIPKPFFFLHVFTLDS